MLYQINICRSHIADSHFSLKRSFLSDDTNSITCSVFYPWKSPKKRVWNEQRYSSVYQYNDTGQTCFHFWLFLEKELPIPIVTCGHWKILESESCRKFLVVYYCFLNKDLENWLENVASKSIIFDFELCEYSTGQ